VALIKERLSVDAAMRPGGVGQFDVTVDGNTVLTRGGNWITRMIGAGYPDFDAVIDLLTKHISLLQH
jgi:hypothetical protein